MLITVRVTRMRQVFDALQETDKAAYRILVKEITDAAKKVQWAAATSVPDRPVSGWGPWRPTRRVYKNDASRDLAFSPADVAAGFKVLKKNFKSYGIARGIGWDVVQQNAGGAVFEVMGDFSRITSDRRYEKQAVHLVKTMNERFPAPKKGTRILTRAYYKGLGDAEAFQARVVGLIEDAARRLGLS